MSGFEGIDDTKRSRKAVGRATLAAVIRRVGRSCIVQTPARGFPLKLHFMMPFVHWLPRTLARQLVRISPFALLARVDATKYFDETRLLSVGEFRRHFPDGQLVIERFAGLPISMIIYRREAS